MTTKRKSLRAANAVHLVEETAVLSLLYAA